MTKWTHETARAEALKYTSRVQFRRGSRGAAAYAERHGFFDEACSHMTTKSPKPYSFKQVAEAAKKYETRVEFRRGSQGEYGRSLRVLTRNGQSIGDMLVAEGLGPTWTGRREPWC